MAVWVSGSGLFEIVRADLSGVGGAAWRVSCLDLLDPLARDANAADLLERAGTAILETETKPYDLLLPIAQLDQNITNSRGQEVARRNINGSRGVLVLDEVAEVGFVLVADGWSSDSGSDRFVDLPDLLDRFIDLRRQLLDSRFTFEFLVHLSLHPLHRFIASTMCTGIRIVRAWSAIARVIARRIHQVARRREFEALGVVELLDRSHQAEVALLHEIKKHHAAADIALGDRHDQTQFAREFIAGPVTVTNKTLVAGKVGEVEVDLAALFKYRQVFDASMPRLFAQRLDFWRASSNGTRPIS